MAQKILVEHITESVKNMTLNVHRNGDASVLPILADALEEAGFNDKSKLFHLRFDFHPGYCFCIVVSEIIDLMIYNKML